MSTEDFKQAVKAYIDLTDDIAGLSKKARELRKQKETVGSVILQYMKANEIDEIALDDGQLTRKVSKRTETLKKEHILAELSNVLDGPRAATVLNNIYSNRGVVEKDMLSRTVRKL